jgi:hypothetical protein
MINRQPCEASAVREYRKPSPLSMRMTVTRNPFAAFVGIFADGRLAGFHPKSCSTAQRAPSF